MTAFGFALLCTFWFPFYLIDGWFINEHPRISKSITAAVVVGATLLVFGITTWLWRVMP